MLSHLDLFSGIGGFALAAKWAGFKTIGFCEKDKFCQQVLTKNFPGIPIQQDIKYCNFNDRIDVMTAGFPCQPFSSAGKKRGKDDERYLWPELLRCINRFKPTWIVIENVVGLLSMGIETLYTDLEESTYMHQTFVLPACAVQAPHRRDRLFIIAHSHSVRSQRRLDYRQERLIQKDIKRYVAQIQQKGEQFIINSWEAFTARDWMQYNASASGRNDGLSSKLDKARIKSLGNAIVPQLIYPILSFIKLLEE